jgi:hypothetical protein
LLFGALAKEDMNTNMMDIQKITEKWNEVRLMDRADAEAQLDAEWLEAYNRFHTKYEEDMERFMEIHDRVGALIERPKMEKKTKGQKKRDAWAKKKASMDARAQKK